MKVLLVAEGQSELGGALASLVKKLLNKTAEFTCEDVRSPKVREHRRPGKGAGFTKRALAWIRYAEQEGFAALVFVIDQDEYVERSAEMNVAQESPHFTLPRALGGAIRTFDAWMLADEQALSIALETTVKRQKSPESIMDPKRICKELRNQSSFAGWPDMYSAVADAIDVATLIKRCPKGFAPFARRVRQL